MKKLLFGVIAFAIIAVTATACLINEKKSQVIPNDEISNPSNPSMTPEVKEEKTIDLYGTYDENDIEFVTVSAYMEHVEIPQIKGLKNKKVEEKVNKEIRDKVNEVLRNDFENLVESEKEMIKCQIMNMGNFSNVLSLNLSVYVEQGTFYKKYDHDLNFNYELVNGNRLKFEDILSKDTDGSTIARVAFYRILSRNYVQDFGENSSKYSPMFDEKKGEWVLPNGGYDYEKMEWIEDEIPYIPRISEQEINEMIKGFISDMDNNFNFTPEKLFLDSADTTAYLYLKDIADKIVIYDKYKTEESIYENDNIGAEDRWTCDSQLNNFNAEYLRYDQDYKFLDENFYYDITTFGNLGYSTYPFMKQYEYAMKLSKDIALQKVISHKEKTKDSPNLHAVFINPSVNYDNGYKWNNGNEIYEYSNLMSITLLEYIDEIEEASRDEYMDIMLAAYRYHNLGFYNGVMNYMYGKPYISDRIVYDARTMRELDIEDVFVVGTDYMSLIKEKARKELGYRYNGEELEDIVENGEYTLSIHGIEIDMPEKEGFYYVTIRFEDFDKSLLTIYNLELTKEDMYILPKSATSQITKEHIQYLSREKLNLAYNEIFARHGHDFKSANLKDYFSLYSWYAPVEGKVVSLEELNDIEKYNLNIIKSVMSEK